MVLKNISTHKFALMTILMAGMVACSPSVVTSTETPPTATVVQINTPTPKPTLTPTPTQIAVSTIQPGDTEQTTMVNNLKRSYLLHIPPGVDDNQPVPVLFVFHGFGGRAEDARMVSGFNEVADKASFIVIYPKGIGTSGNDLAWNAGGCCGLAMENNLDESAFIRKILADLGSIASLDSKRIYSVGFSNGAMLSYRLACDMSDVFAAVGSVSGTLVYSPCDPQEPVSVIHIHALDDNSIPFAGSSSIGFPAIEDVITMWAQVDGCTGSPLVENQLNDTLTHTVYPSCNSGTAVDLYVFKTGGHSWPSYYVWDASNAIWDFFASHPKP